MLEARNLWELVERRAAATPDDVMLVDEHGDELTFGQYHDAALRAAAGLADVGVTAGAVVSWQLPTRLASVTLVGALARLSAVQNPILPIYREREVGFAVRQTAASLLLVPPAWRGFDFPAMAEEISKDGGGVPVVVVIDRTLPEGDPSSLPPAPRPSDDPPVRWIFYTSGTTADPKGAQHTDGTILAAARGMTERLAVTDADRNALAFPFTHIGGITWLFTSLMTGCSNILMEAFDPVATPEVLRRERVTLAGSGTPFHMAYLAAQRAEPDVRLFPEVRAFPGGGAPKPPQLHHDVKRELGGAGIVTGWGLTEAPILTMASVEDDDDELAETEGKAMPGVELRVVGIDGEPARPGGSGELRAKAPQLMKGYLDPSLDADAFDEDGWFRTGDLGCIDERGNVIITGRLKDVIIRHGENISAKEVEDLLYAHPKVADVAVIGLPDEKTGERCCAVVALADVGDPLSFDEMSAFLDRHGLRRQAVPEQLEIVEVVPRNPAGKIQKHDLRAQFSR
jgi:acyl-CoA synthetase (AMP-forming)/AMP-acid ligase II